MFCFRRFLRRTRRQAGGWWLAVGVGEAEVRAQRQVRVRCCCVEGNMRATCNTCEQRQQRHNTINSRNLSTPPPPRAVSTTTTPPSTAMPATRRPQHITQIVSVDDIPDGWMGLDNGPESTKLIQVGATHSSPVTGRVARSREQT